MPLAAQMKSLCVNLINVQHYHKLKRITQATSQCKDMSDRTIKSHAVQTQSVSATCNTQTSTPLLGLNDFYPCFRASHCKNFDVLLKSPSGNESAFLFCREWFRKARLSLPTPVTGCRFCDAWRVHVFLKGCLSGFRSQVSCQAVVYLGDLHLIYAYGVGNISPNCQPIICQQSRWMSSK